MEGRAEPPADDLDKMERLEDQARVVEVKGAPRVDQCLVDC